MFAVCCLALAACKEEPQPDVPAGPAPEDLYVQFGEQGGTKSHFVSSDGKKTYTHYWDANDDISVFWENTKNLMYRANNINGSSYSDFKQLSYSTGSSTAITGRYAIYPYCNTNSVSVSGNTPTFNFWFPSAQTYREGSFGTASYNNGTDSKNMGCAVYIAKNKSTTSANNNYFDFYNMGCWMRLDLKTDASGVFSVGSIEMEAGGDVKIVGPASFAGDPNTVLTAKSTSFGSGTFAIGSGATNKITLSCPTGGVALNSTTSVPFYFFLMPVAADDAAKFTSGFTVKVKDTSGNIRAELTSIDDIKSNTTIFHRNQVVNLATVTISSSSIKYSLSVQSWTNVTAIDINLE